MREGGDLHLRKIQTPPTGQLCLYNPQHNPNISRVADHGDSGELYYHCVLIHAREMARCPKVLETKEQLYIDECTYNDKSPQTKLAAS